MTAAPRRRRHDPLPPTGSGRVVPPGPSTIDLHTHTTRSDGVVAPAELVAAAADAGVRLLAMTDHDTLAGYREVVAGGAVPTGRDARSRRRDQRRRDRADLGLWEGELHILGFGVDPADEAFEAALAAQRGRRRERFERTVARLRELELPIDDQLARPVGLGRRRPRPADVARALIAAGHADERRGRLRPAISAGGSRATCRASGLGPVEAIAAIRAAGGLPVLAHFGEAPVAGRGRPRARRGRARRARGLLPLVRRRDGRRGRRGRRGARPRRDRRQRLPRRHEHVRRGACRAVGPAGGGRRIRAPAALGADAGRGVDDARRRLADTAMTDRSTPQPRPADARRSRRAVAGGRRVARPRPPTTASPSTCPRRGPCRVPRLDARLPDEPERLRGDGRTPPGRRLRGGADARGRRPRRHQHLRDPRGRRAEGHRPAGPARPAQGRQPGAARRPDRLLRPRAGPGRPPPSLSGRGPVPAPGRGARARRSARTGLGAGADRGDRARRRRSAGPSSAPRTAWPGPGPGGRRRGPSRAARRSPPGCRSSTAATRRAPTASSRSAAARSGAARSTRSSTRRARSRRPATAR